MIDYSEIKDGDAWEAFCRDYLVTIGLVVDIPPGRGPDGGRDLIVTEQLKGSLATRPFVWLVSCKHYAGSGKAVGTDNESNIVDRMEQHKADGFIGFYSTVASAALIARLNDLRDQKKIKAFELFDGARIENGFHGTGLSGVLLQHLPKSHTELRPIHPLLDVYMPLECEVCGKDLLKLSLRRKMRSVIIFGRKSKIVEEVHFACKGECDRRISSRLNAMGYLDAWDDLEDYCNPLIFIRRITGYINQMRETPSSYSENAHKKMIDLYMAVSQMTLRQTSKEDREHYFNAREAEEFGF